MLIESIKMDEKQKQKQGNLDFKNQM